jgi:hypothetical protein
MKERMAKMMKHIQNIETISKKIFKYGFLASLLLFFLSGTIYIMNHYFLSDSTLAFNSSQLMMTSINIFAQVIIGGLIIDYFAKSNK